MCMLGTKELLRQSHRSSYRTLPHAFDMLCQLGEQFLQCMVTGDETWRLETPIISPRKEIKSNAAIRFWQLFWAINACGLWISLTMITLTAESYCGTVERLQLAMHCKRCGCCTIILYGNTGPHTVNWICNRLWHWLGGYGPPSLQSVLYAK